MASSPENLSELLRKALWFVEQGRPADALPLVETALGQRPGDPDIHNRRGDVMMSLGNDQQALASYRAALALKSDHADALFNIGNIFAASGQFDQALSHYNSLLTSTPNHAGALNNRGNVFVKLGRFHEAITDFDRLLAAQPFDLNALMNRATALKRIGKFEDALRCYDSVLARDPASVKARYNRGNALLDLARPAEAEQEFRRALFSDTNNWNVHVSLACALLDLRRPEESIESYRRALALSPNQPVFHSDLIFALNFDSSSDTAAQQRERSRWHDRHASSLAAIRSPQIGPKPKERLRIGYVSAHFCRQAATYVFGGVLANHDHDHFEVVCYSDTPQEDELTERLRGYASNWRRTSGLSDDRLAELIRSDEIDILVDLVGHMKGQRLLTFARKPAPIQITAWGEPTGTGLKTIDYLFADPVLVPTEERPLFAERIFDLPCALAFWSPDSLPDVGPLPALSGPGVTFGSFNRFQKLTRPVIDAWAAILRRVPNSRLILKEFAPDASIVADFVSRGVGPERIRFIKPAPRWEHFCALNEIDIALDPFPHGGGMTTLDALWMGVPVVTYPGRTVSSRLATACNTAVGLTEFVAGNLEEYVDIAVAKAADLVSLAACRAGLRARVAATPVGDPERYARSVEEAYRIVWRRHASIGKAARAIGA